MSIDLPVRAHTPTTESDDDRPGNGQSRDSNRDGQNAGEEPEDAAAPKRKPGGYNSRIEQILYENPKMQIMITEAGKSLESGGRYIVYTIRTGVRPQPPYLIIRVEGMRLMTISRTSRCDDDIPSLHRFEMP